MAKFKVGDRVTFNIGGGDFSGVVTEVDENAYPTARYGVLLDEISAMESELSIEE